VRRIGIGLLGSGFAAALHAEADRLLHGYDARIDALYSTSAGAEEFARKHGIPRVCRSLEELLSIPGIEVVDVCAPPAVHVSAVRAIVESGRHVICEKPLNGYFGAGEREVGKTDKLAMYARVMGELDELRAYLTDKAPRFFYAENFVYAPSVLKVRELLLATRNKILLIKGEESHSGSHSARAARWSEAGGGTFIRQGCHPLSCALYLKAVEAESRGERIGLASVVADVGNTIGCVPDAELGHIAARPADVEDWANVVLTFTDGTKASVMSGDMVVGGVRNTMEVFTTSGAYLCNIAPNDQLRAYHIEGRGLEGEYFTEKVETKLGWQDLFLSEALNRGYIGELQDFMECVDTGREPRSGFDLAYDTMRVVYGAYVSAERGERFRFQDRA